MNKPGKRYNEDFKADIIRLIREEKHSVSDVVKDFGVNNQIVRNWPKKIKDNQDPDKVKITELEAEIRTKNKKIADQEEPIDILRKVTSIFAQIKRT